MWVHAFLAGLYGPSSRRAGPRPLPDRAAARTRDAAHVLGAGLSWGGTGEECEGPDIVTYSSGRSTLLSRHVRAIDRAQVRFRHSGGRSVQHYATTAQPDDALSPSHGEFDLMEAADHGQSFLPADP
jgi:hypothetical protein